MIAMLRRLQEKAASGRVVEWTKLISITGGAQFIIQVLGLVSGIIIIRLLSTEQYALYTLANTMLGTLTVLADGGISIGVMAQGGKVWQNKNALGAVLTTGLALRRKFAIGSLIVSTPVLLYLLIHNGASWLMAGLIALALIPAFFAALSDTLWEIAPKLQQDIFPLQKNQVEANLGRLVLTALSVFVFPFAAVAVIGYGLPRVWANIRLRKIAAKHADLTQKPDPEVQREILTVVKRTLPGAIYYCLSGQITIWIISFFGSTSSLASVGALTRLAVLLNFFMVIFSTIVVPRFARMPYSKALLMKFFLNVFVGTVVLIGSILAVVYIFPSQILWILGSDYKGLHNELFLTMGSGCLGLIQGFVYHLSISRGWVVRPIVFIPLNLLSIILGAALFNLTTLAGVLEMNLFVNGATAFIYFIYFSYRINRVED